jgi:hypothetical protein
MSFFKIVWFKKTESTNITRQESSAKNCRRTCKRNPFSPTLHRTGPSLQMNLSSNVTFTHKFDHNKEEAVFNKRLYMVNSMALLGAVNKGLTDNIGKSTFFIPEDFDSKEQYATTFW